DSALDRALDTPQGTSLEQHLGIGIAAERAARRLELAPDVAIIVDLAIECDDVAKVCRVHGLGAARTEVDDREPSLPQHRPALGLDPDRAGVRAAMAQRLD